MIAETAGVRGPQQMFFICWGARPARSEPEARTARLRRFCGRDAHGYRQSLDQLIRSVNPIDSPAKNHGYPFAQREEGRELWLLFQQRVVFVAAKLYYRLR